MHVSPNCQRDSRDMTPNVTRVTYLKYLSLPRLKGQMKYVVIFWCSSTGTLPTYYGFLLKLSIFIAKKKYACFAWLAWQFLRQFLSLKIQITITNLVSSSIPHYTEGISLIMTTGWAVAGVFAYESLLCLWVLFLTYFGDINLIHVLQAVNK